MRQPIRCAVSITKELRIRIIAFSQDVSGLLLCWKRQTNGVPRQRVRNYAILCTQRSNNGRVLPKRKQKWLASLAGRRCELIKCRSLAKLVSVNCTHFGRNKPDTKEDHHKLVFCRRQTVSKQFLNAHFLVLSLCISLNKL